MTTAFDMIVRCSLRQPLPPVGMAASSVAPCDLCGTETAEPFRYVTPLICPTCRLRSEAGL